MIDDGTDRLLASVDLGPALDRALANLDEPFRSAVQLVDVEDQSVRRIEETELAGDFGEVRTDDAIVRGVNLAVVSESRTGPSAHNRLQVAH